MAVNDERIVATASDVNLPKAASEIDAAGNYIFPGATDTHRHYGCTNFIKENASVKPWRSATRAPAISRVTTAINRTRGNHLSKSTDKSSFNPYSCWRDSVKIVDLEACFVRQEYIRIIVAKGGRAKNASEVCGTIQR